MKSQKREDKQDAVLQIRASLGTWKLANITTTILDRNVTPQMDLRQYEVTEQRGSYRQPLKYNITHKETLAKIKSMQQVGYKLTAPQFPELQEFFRNGRPITAADLFEDAFNEIEIVDDNRTGLEFLMDNY